MTLGMTGETGDVQFEEQKTWGEGGPYNNAVAVFTL